MSRAQRTGRARPASIVVAALAASLLTVALWPTTEPEPVVLDAAAVAAEMTGDPADLIESHLPGEYRMLTPDAAAERAASVPDLAMALNLNRPDPQAADPLEAGLARLTEVEVAAPSVSEVFDRLPADTVGWLTVVFPASIGNLSGAPYDSRATANRIRLVATVADSRSWPTPDRPWTAEDRQVRPDFQRVVERDHELLYFDPLANNGQGSWVELVGELDDATYVGVLVPGGSAFISSDNFTRYSDRAGSFVDASDGSLAMIVWAGAPFPSGWIQEASPTWAQDAAAALTAFVSDLRRQVGDDVTITLAGHSYGGAVVGLAETRELDVDQVMHLASAGAGFGVTSPDDYTRPCRIRYDMMAPGDPIGFVQNIPGITGLGHGVEVSTLPGVRRLLTGAVPDDPDAFDDVHRTLGSLGIAGKEIGGMHAHSEIFIPQSDAWRNMYAVFTMGDPRLLDDQPPPVPGCA
ncbi:alpha/beta hydrolase [Stackebrandtia endophytica]|uniref:alpha/beta hydrolase n=1 Tax=Stackebrandtia endophytica TaxID=1496996 RepID=UPI00114F8749|nr:alpha/beta hydrolase [Stackebrandtia endophytica]